MPSIEMSLNLLGISPEAEVSRKRSHDEYSDGGDVAMEDAPELGQAEAVGGGSPATVEPNKSAPATNSDSSSHATSSSASLLTKTSTSNSATAPPTPQQPAKRKKPTTTDKEEKERERLAKAKAAEEKERERVAKAKAAEEEKAAKAEEKAKLAEERAKAAEEKKAAKEVEQRKKDEKKAAREEEQRKRDEEQRKKDDALKKQQNRMASFFGTPKKKVAVVSQAGEAGAATAADGAEKTAMAPPEKTEYEKRFQPFFIKAETRMATRPFAMDEATEAQRTAALDEHIAKQQDGKETDFEASASKMGEMFRTGGRSTCRGISRRPVRFIMEKYHEASERGETAKVQQLRAELATIPYKTIAFREDVRPPYRGTLTLQPHLLGHEGMARLARHPASREILPLHYDYDSEAEWVDEEDGEDVDMDDDDDELEEEDDMMDGFLDDSQDAGVARHAFQGDMEPESSGLCFEDQNRQGPNGEVYKYRMEFMLDSTVLQHTHSFDPFSTEYWTDTSKPKTKATAITLGDTTAATTAATAATAASATTANATPLAAISANTVVDPARLKGIKPDALKIFKAMIKKHREYTKSTLEDMLAKDAGITKLEAKTMLATLAYASGKGRSRVWSLKEGV